jgi:hypothetical protein
MFAVAVKEVGISPEDLPDDGETESQGAEELTLQSKVSCPLLEISTV